MLFSTLFFDLDATLYPASNGLWDLIRLRIYQYMREELGLAEEVIPATRDRYWKTYGTTLEGLRIHHQVDPDDYLAYVHDLPLDQYLQHDQELRDLLISLPQDLWVFTNSDRRHADGVLKKLGIADIFTGIVDLISMDFVIKPNPKAYQIALAMAGGVDPENCVLFDDLLANLNGAKKIGITTALVGENGISDHVDYHLPAIHAIKEKMPQLWIGKKEQDQNRES
jgi:putative hydrolase of the HAD superfamily